MNKVKLVVLYLVFLIVLVGITFESGLRIKGTYKTFHELQSGKYSSLYISPDNPYMQLNKSREFVMTRPEFQIDYKTNSLGYREKEYNSTKDSNPRIFIFGDSFVEGMGAVYDSTWPRFLEREITAVIANASVNICASSSADPFVNTKAFSDLILPLEPTHVLFVVNPTDLDDYLVRGGVERFTGDGKVQYRKAPWFEFLYRRSHLLRFILIEGYGYDLHMIRPIDKEVDRINGAVAISNVLDNARQLCAEKNIRFMIVTHPIPKEICKSNPELTAAHHLFDQYIQGNDVIHLSEVLEQTMGYPNCNSYFWPEDGHFNGRGYQIFGEALYRAINDRQPAYWTIDTE